MDVATKEPHAPDEPNDENDLIGNRFRKNSREINLPLQYSAPLFPFQRATTGAFDIKHAGITQ